MIASAIPAWLRVMAWLALAWLASGAITAAAVVGEGAV